MSTPPHRALSGGTMEYGQTLIMQKILSAHNLHEVGRRAKTLRQHYGSTTGGTANSPTQKGGYGSPILTKHERDPLLQVEEGKVPKIEHIPRQVPADQAHKVQRFFSRQGSSHSSERLAEPVASLDRTLSSLSTGSSPFKVMMMMQSSQSIRFQVLVWNVGALDVVQGRVPVTFRVTIFWNDDTSLRGTDDVDALDSNDSVSTPCPHRFWEMRGRQKAVPVRGEKDEAGGPTIDVPPVSILNVVTFDTIGSPEITLLRPDCGLWQWTCMYRATLIQDHWKMDNFPHDEHDINLKLAVLANRKPDARWDRRLWHLGLATEKDSMGCVRVPHGLVVGNLNIPEFNHDNDLKFSFEPVDIGPGGTHMNERCLAVKLRVRRNSYYYDRNVVPLLGLLNFVAITITALGAEQFFQRGLLTLNIAFVEISIRMATDKHLPSVPYKIKLQRVLNEYFFGLLFLVVESNLVFELQRYGYAQYTGIIDTLAAGSVLSHNVWTLYDYYIVSRRRTK